MNAIYEDCLKAAAYVKEKSNGFVPDIGLILGTGFGSVDSLIEDPVAIPYKEIPGFLVSTAPDHKGCLYLGTSAGKKIVCMSGRFHSYEGYSYEQLSIPVRVLGLLGIKKLIVTNAAGGINTSYAPGDLMIIADHIKLFGDSPMKGPNIGELGPRFFDCSHIYSEELRKVARSCAEGSGLTVHEGVYFFFTGPQYETPAEIRAARLLGGDAAGMSTVTESLTASHMGIPVLGLTMVSNMAAGVLDKPLSEEEVLETAGRVSPLVGKYLYNIIRNLP